MNKTLLRKIIAEELCIALAEAPRKKKHETSKLALTAENFPKSWNEYRKFIAAVAQEVGLPSHMTQEIADTNYEAGAIAQCLWDAWQGCEVEVGRAARAKDAEARELGADAVAGTVHDLFIEMLDTDKSVKMNRASVAQRADAAVSGFGVPDYEKSDEEKLSQAELATVIEGALSKLRVKAQRSDAARNGDVTVRVAKSSKPGRELFDAVSAALKKHHPDFEQEDVGEAPELSTKVGDAEIDVQFDWTDAKSGGCSNWSASVSSFTSKSGYKSMFSSRW